MNNNKERPSRIAYGIVLCIMLLAIIGLFSLYSTTVLIEGEGIRMTVMQLIWYIIGTGVALPSCFLTLNNFENNRLFILIGIIVLLTLIFYDRGLAASGRKRWVKIPIINFMLQPSEFVKFPYILILAKTTTLHNAKYLNRTVKSDFLLLGKLISWSILPLALIMLQPDLGTTLVYAAILGGVILMSGIQWKILIPIIGAVLLAGVGAVYLVVYNREILKNLFGLREYQFLE